MDSVISIYYFTIMRRQTAFIEDLLRCWNGARTEVQTSEREDKERKEHLAPQVRCSLKAGTLSVAGNLLPGAGREPALQGTRWSSVRNSYIYTDAFEGERKREINVWKALGHFCLTQCLTVLNIFFMSIVNFQALHKHFHTNFVIYLLLICQTNTVVSVLFEDSLCFLNSEIKYKHC